MPQRVRMKGSYGSFCSAQISPFPTSHGIWVLYMGPSFTPRVKPTKILGLAPPLCYAHRNHGRHLEPQITKSLSLEGVLCQGQAPINGGDLSYLVFCEETRSWKGRKNMLNLSFTCQAALRWGRKVSIRRAAGRGIHGEMTIFLLLGQNIRGRCSACGWGLEGSFLVLFCLL